MFTPESERYSDRDELSLEIKRQVFHLFLILLWCVPINYFPYQLTLLIFSTVIAVNLLVVYRYEPLAGLFHRFIVELEREKNLSRPGIQALYANLGIFLSYILFGKLSLLGVVILAVGDSFSTLIGKVFGRHELFFNPEKTWEGTLSFFLSVYIVLLLWVGFEKALLFSCIASIVEAMRLKVDDNFLVPVIVTSLAYLM